jgi:hypothetical protein
MLFFIYMYIYMLFIVSDVILASIFTTYTSHIINILFVFILRSTKYFNRAIVKGHTLLCNNLIKKTYLRSSKGGTISHALFKTTNRIKKLSLS